METENKLNNFVTSIGPLQTKLNETYKLAPE